MKKLEQLMFTRQREMIQPRRMRKLKTKTIHQLQNIRALPTTTKY